MEYSKEETEDWFLGGELPDKNTKLGIKEYIFDDVTLTLDKNLHPTIKSSKSIKLKLLEFKYEYHSSKGENIVLLRLSYQQGKEVVRVTKEIIEK
ncbi:hypothetical protein [Ligilactobacillus salivarius]|uniref:hypothetical protein n=1 Tax=Ligilactobacillus salivarius TaxID=1624 RepID=UPI0022E0BA63|nr:hypothetical protein [Ligilactobacillus salivarius]